MYFFPESYSDFKKQVDELSLAHANYVYGMIHKEGAYFGWRDKFLGNTVTSSYCDTKLIKEDEKTAEAFFTEAARLGHKKAKQQVEVLAFKKDYMQEYNSTSFFKRNPFSYMRNNFDKFNSLKQIMAYAQENPETRTAKILMQRNNR